MKSYQQFFAELKRRRVFRVMAVYGIVGFVILQIVDLAVPALLLPEWTYRLVALILLLGFPVAIILAWAFEMTPEGVQKTQAATAGELGAIIASPVSQRLPSGLMALIGVAALVLGAWWVTTKTAAESDPSASESAPADVRLAFTDPADDTRPSIAVLPFADMSPEGNQEYFSDGMTEEILNVLSKIGQMRVAARTSTFALKNRELTAVQWGDTLGVGYLVEGSVRKAGEQVRITVQLIDTEDGSHLWSESYTEELTAVNVFQMQAEIAEAIAGALTVPLGLAGASDLVTPTADLEAYDLYLAGRAELRRRGTGVFEATRLFEAALARDSAWAPVWAALAESRSFIPFYAPGPDDPPVPPDSAYWARNFDAAKTAASRALELDPTSASATTALANVLRDQWEWEASEAAYMKALTLDPDNVEAHQQYAEFLMYVGRGDEALRVARQALALDQSPIRLLIAGYVSMYNGLYADAIDLLSQAVRRDTNADLPWPRGFLLSSFVSSDEWGPARELARELVAEFAPDYSAEIQQALSQANGAPTTIDPDQLLALPRGTLLAAQFWMLTAETDRALDILELADEQPPFGQTTDLWHPSFDPLRGEPRFEALLRRRGLAGRLPIRASGEGNP